MGYMLTINIDRRSIYALGFWFGNLFLLGLSLVQRIIRAINKIQAKKK